VTDSRSTPSPPVGADPASDSTSENTAISTSAMATQRLRSAMRNSVAAVERMRVIDAAPWLKWA
jgi:hypothetical protein